jgi:hypothetical protein
LQQFDEQVVRLDKQILETAAQFVLVRILDMRGVNLTVFDFDYDLVWAGLFLNADETVYGRYGSRDALSADADVSLAGLNYAMRRALEAHRQHGREPVILRRPARTVEDFAAARRVEKSACIHCHQVYDFQRTALREAGKWHQDDAWVYPRPENLGMFLEPNQADRLCQIKPGSAAAVAGLRAGDRLLTVNGLAIASCADVQYALHSAPAKGEVPVTWRRGETPMKGTIALADDWRQTDLSWRASTRRLGPNPAVYGEDLTAQEKQTLGLSANRLAFRQGPFPTLVAQQAGIRANDIVIGIDDRALEMTAVQFGVYIRLNYHVGDRVVFNLIRNGKRANVPLTLPSVARY